jgi:hypothetical protein
MCLFVFTEIPEALTFTPFSSSLRCGERPEGVGRVENARFLCFVDGIGDCFCSIDCGGGYADE